MKIFRLGALITLIALLQVSNAQPMITRFVPPTAAMVGGVVKPYIPAATAQPIMQKHHATSRISPEDLANLQAASLEGMEYEAQPKGWFEQTKADTQQFWKNQQQRARQTWENTQSSGSHGWSKFKPYGKHLASAGAGAAGLYAYQKAKNKWDKWYHPTITEEIQVGPDDIFQNQSHVQQLWIKRANENLIKAIELNDLQKIEQVLENSKGLLDLDQALHESKNAITLRNPKLYRNIIRLLIKNGANRYLAARLMSQQDDSTFTQELLENTENPHLERTIQKLANDITKAETEFHLYKQKHQQSDSLAIQQELNNMTKSLSKLKQQLTYQQEKRSHLDALLVDAINKNDPELTSTIINAGATNLDQIKNILHYKGTMPHIITLIDQKLLEQKQQHASDLKQRMDAQDKELISDIKTAIANKNTARLSELVQKVKNPHVLDQALRNLTKDRWWSISTQQDMINELLKQGANPQIALQWATKNNNKAFIKSLYEQYKTRPDITSEILQHAIASDNPHLTNNVLHNTTQKTKDHVVIQSLGLKKPAVLKAALDAGGQPIPEEQFIKFIDPETDKNLADILRSALYKAQ